MKIIEEILSMEFEMFISVPSVGNPSCRDAPDNFRLHRGAQFSVWSDDTLESYLGDLKNAVLTGRNLMLYKYARMDELIPAENESLLIDLIVKQQSLWQTDLFERFSSLKENARGLTDVDDSPLDVSFKRYLEAELESYSEQTLELLYRDILKYKAEGINMSEKIYENLAAAAGCDISDILY